MINNIFELLGVRRLILIIFFALGVPTSFYALELKMAKNLAQEVNCGVTATVDILEVTDNIIIQGANNSKNQNAFDSEVNKLSECLKNIDHNIGSYKFFTEVLPETNKQLNRLKDIN
ncbi:hypothetical protein [Citrobacter koseri]|uniref:hypothetical protein n=1 Tax=Citrobacter koseri TaxID=545 RepID=UPI0028BD7224|nr:hypothetical protein [Citrobacter koseri]MDT7486034.1 hypothetical protein [Citrobacter koseri]